MRLHMLFLSLAVIGLAACSERASDSAGRTVDPGSGGIAPTSQVEAAYNIGDVETGMKLSVHLADKSKSANVEYAEMETLRGDLAMAEARLSQPYPDQIWLMSRAKALPTIRGTDAIVVHQRIFLEGREGPIAEKSFVWTGTRDGRPEQTLEVDLVPFLESKSGSALVHARAEVIWLPDTEAALIDPAGNFSSAQRVEKLSNSLRINFN